MILILCGWEGNRGSGGKYWHQQSLNKLQNRMVPPVITSYSLTICRRYTNYLVLYLCDKLSGSWLSTSLTVLIGALVVFNFLSP